MDLAEAQKVAYIAGTADKGCASCVSDMVDRLNKSFPEYRWTMTDDVMMEQLDWSDDPEDTAQVGVVVTVEVRE